MISKLLPSAGIPSTDVATAVGAAAAYVVARDLEPIFRKYVGTIVEDASTTLWNCVLSGVVLRAFSP